MSDFIKIQMESYQISIYVCLVTFDGPYDAIRKRKIENIFINWEVIAS